jgi:hypothetical protein
MDMKKLLEAVTKFAGEPEQKPGDQVRGTEVAKPNSKKHPFKDRLVGDSKDNMLKGLSQVSEEKSLEWALAEAYANFMEDDLGVEEKRPARKGSRPAREYTKNGQPSKRYNQVNEYKKDPVNFTSDDIKELEGIRDLQTLKDRAFALISKPSQRPMKPEKVQWFKQAIDSKTSSLAIIKLMYDLLLSGEGAGVIGSRNSMSSNSYRQRFNEGWGRGNDRVTLSDESTLYWSGKGPLQKEYDALYNELVPSMGKADTIEGEVLRAASKIVYRHYNDGDDFNQASFEQLVPYIGAVTSYDDLAHKSTEFAIKANGNYTPNPNWDSLDVMEYGPEEDDYDDEEDDDYDDWSDNVDNEEEDDEDEEELDEVKHFRTAYGWAGGRNEKTGGTHKHPDQIKADREAKKAAKQQSKDAFDDMFGGGNPTKGLGIREDGVDEISSWGISQEEWADFEAQFETAKQVFANMDDEDIPEAFQLFERQLDSSVVDALDYGLLGGNYERFLTKLLRALSSAQQSEGTEPRAALDLATMVLGRVASQFGNEMQEGWESGPEERSYRSRRGDPDAGYDAMRQEKADAEAQAAQAKRPQKKYYTLSGRGPNQEPNYEFPGEYDSQDEADAARARLMADPKTPNPRDIGIRSRTKYLDLKEGIESGDPVESAVLSAVQELIQQGHTEVAPEVITNMVVAATSQPFLLKDLVDANKNSPAIQHYVDSINPTKVKFSSDILTVKNENPAKSKEQAQNGVANMAARAAGRNRLGEASTPLRDREDYNAKSKALQDIQMDPSTSQDPQLSAEVARRKAELVQQAKSLGISESRAHKLIANKLKQIELQRQMGSPESDAAYAQHVDRLKKSKEEYLKKTPNTIYKRGIDEAGANNPMQGSTTVNNPVQAKQVAQATNTLKAATGSTAPTTNIVKALDAASQGKAVATTDMKVLEPLMKDVATVAQDPKLANQFKSLANQVNQTQKLQQQPK